MFDAKSIKIEICCASAEDAINAHIGGASRIELCSNMYQGGLTPTSGTLELIKKNCDIRTMVMLRPREGGFNYSELEYQTLLLDAKRLLELGADGLVFGFLKENGSLDRQRTKELVELASGRELCFHRAFDVVPNWRETMDELVELGVNRILTSGQEQNALLGLDTLKEMQDYAAGRITIMPGGGIRLRTYRKVQEYTGCKELHMRLTKTCYDASSSQNSPIYFGTPLYPSETEYKLVDSAEVAKLRNL